MAESRELATSSLALDEELDITGYSIGFVLETLEKHNRRFREARGTAKVDEISVKNISGGKGYLSRVFLTTVKFDQPSKTPYSFVMKIPTVEFFTDGLKNMTPDAVIDDEQQQKYVNGLHSNECEALAIVTRLEGIPFPETYFLQKAGVSQPCGLAARSAPGMIMMEALDGVTLNLYRSVTKAQCLNIAEVLARFHDGIAQLDEKEWKGLCTCRVILEADWASDFGQFVDSLLEVHPEIKNDCDEVFSLDYLTFARMAIQELPKSLNAWSVIHGDVWTSNIMFGKNADGSCGDRVLALLDYQLSFEGNPMLDFARFLTTGAEADVRRDVCDEALKHYYDTLCLLYGRRGRNPTYSFEDCERLFDFGVVHQAFHMALMRRFFDSNNFHANSEVVEAQSAQFALRTKYVVQDAAKLVRKHRIHEMLKEYRENCHNEHIRCMD